MVFFLVTLLLPNLPGFDPLQFVQFSFIGGFKNFDHTSLLHDIIITSMSETSQHFHQKYAKITQKSPQDLPLLRKLRRSQFVLYCWCLSTLEYDPVHFLVLWTLIKNWIEVISISVFEFKIPILSVILIAYSKNKCLFIKFMFNNFRYWTQIDIESNT